LVIRNRIEFCEIEKNIVHVGAGYGFALLGSQTARKGLSGLEFAAGIPATVGGAVYMNAGANGQETFDALREVLYLNEWGEITNYSKGELKSGYRFSSFQEMNGAILAARFLLQDRGDGVQGRHRSLIKKRVETQPLKERSAGCIFRNPLGSAAGALIERCGLKGLQVGGAKVSEVHGNFIVNDDRATAKDVRELIDQVRQRVLEETGVLLEPEVRWVSFETI
jgi:UDP-N-acetylmuramate dehydrogenase